MSDPILAELERERYGDLRNLKRETFARPLERPLEGPRDWTRRRAVLLECLEGIPQNYRRPQRRTRRAPVKRGRGTATVQRMAA